MNTRGLGVPRGERRVLRDDGKKFIPRTPAQEQAEREEKRLRRVRTEQGEQLKKENALAPKATREAIDRSAINLGCMDRQLDLMVDAPNDQIRTVRMAIAKRLMTGAEYKRMSTEVVPLEEIQELTRDLVSRLEQQYPLPSAIRKPSTKTTRPDRKSDKKAA
jgi:hypothetical protein